MIFGVVLSILCIVSLLFSEETKLQRGGYTSLKSFVDNMPDVNDSTMYLAEEEVDTGFKKRYYNLLYIKDERAVKWRSSRELWGYSDGMNAYIYENGVFSELLGFNEKSAWFFSISTKTSSGPNGIYRYERPYLYEASENRSREITFGILATFIENAPVLLAEYEETPRSERKISYFMNRYYERNRFHKSDTNDK